MGGGEEFNTNDLDRAVAPQKLPAIRHRLGRCALSLAELASLVERHPNLAVSKLGAAGKATARQAFEVVERPLALQILHDTCCRLLPPPPGSGAHSRQRCLATRSFGQIELASWRSGDHRFYSVGWQAPEHIDSIRVADSAEPLRVVQRNTSIVQINDCLKAQEVSVRRTFASTAATDAAESSPLATYSAVAPLSAQRALQVALLLQEVEPG